MSHPAAGDLLDGLSAVFTSLGRALLCLDASLRVTHASRGLDQLASPGAQQAVLGHPIEEILGTRLFGQGGALRRALQAGELREGWGATLRHGAGEPVDVSLTVAPLADHAAICDPRVTYVVVLRPYRGMRIETPDEPVVFCRMIARSTAMLRIFSLIEHLRSSDATVLVTGASGTGKELVARALHNCSRRRAGAFVAVNCGALPGPLLESELFGHVRGAFTGAVRDRRGRFEVAEGGTLFLDEVGDLPLPLQVKLLRVLQEHAFERVGESVTRTTNARIIAATHLDLRRAVVEGGFRDDLYYRLRVVPIELPPLSARREDIEPLVAHLLERLAAKTGRALELAPDVLPALLGHDWPGNVRELENALELATAVCQGQTLHAQHLPSEVTGRSTGFTAAIEPHPARLSSAEHGQLEGSEPERQRLVAALDAHHWRRADAACALGMSRTTLWRKMREHGLLD